MRSRGACRRDRMPVADSALGQSGRRRFVAGDLVDHREAAHARSVRDEGEVAAVGRHREALDVPRNFGRDRPQRVRDRVEISELRELAAEIRDEINAAPIGRKARGPDAARRRFERNRGDAARRGVGQPEFALQRIRLVHEQQSRAIRRPVEHAPALRAGRDQQACLLRPARLECDDIPVHAIHRRARKGDDLAVGRPDEGPPERHGRGDASRAVVRDAPGAQLRRCAGCARGEERHARRARRR